jgi:hypothetical protein
MAKQPKTIFLKALVGLAILIRLSIHFSPDAMAVDRYRAKSRSAPLSRHGDRTKKRRLARSIIVPKGECGQQGWDRDAGH